MIEYVDYLMSGEHLDDPLPSDSKQTFRDKFAPRIDLNEIRHSPLTNISGVGIFIITSDNKIIVSKHSRNVRVWGGIWSYSASGTMSWKENVHPFFEMDRECQEEIGHKINLEHIKLFGFGADAKKLYFQFSFFERTPLSSDEILSKAPMAEDFHAEMEKLIPIPFELETIVNLVKNENWEPAAAAGLLTLCAKEFGFEKLERAIDPDFVRTRMLQVMEFDWDQRAERRGVLAVMSARYPFHRCDSESQKYVDAVEDFIGNDINEKDVVEVGVGIGRMTEWLVLRAGRLTGLDISQVMIDRNKKRLGDLAKKVTYIKTFAQDYRPSKPHDVAIVSLVLIHNVDKLTFNRLVEAFHRFASTVFLFEHTDVSYQVSNQTRPRTENELLKAFKEYRVERRREYQLFHDNLIFLKLAR
jgi:hypothetical protein